MTPTGWLLILHVLLNQILAVNDAMKCCQRTVDMNFAQTERVRLNQRQIVESEVAMDLIQFDRDFTSQVIEDICNKTVNHFFRQNDEIFCFFYHQIQDDC